MSDPVPDDFARTIVRVRGTRAEPWLERLPGAIDHFAHHWSLRVGPPFPNLSYNYVAPVTRADGTPAVLKIGFVEDPELHTEADALRLFNGHGMALLLDADLTRGALLLERLEPGRSLAEAPEEESTLIAANVMRRLWRPPPAFHRFPTVANWASGIQRLLRDRYHGGTGPLPPDLVGRAEATFANLLNTSPGDRVLHGDLHPDNILSGRREPWLAIDPKGIVGEPAYEIAPYLHNPWQWLNTMSADDRLGIISRRVDVFATVLGIDRGRILAYGFAQAVLSAVWTLDGEGNNWQSPIASARLIERIPVN